MERSCDRSATERGRVSGCREGSRAGKKGKKNIDGFSFGLRKQLHSSAALAEGAEPRSAAAARWLRGRLGGPKRPSKRGRGRGRRWPRHQLLLLAEGRVRVSPGEAEAERRIPIPARWQPDQNPALCRLLSPSSSSLQAGQFPRAAGAPDCPPFPGAGRERLAGLAHSGGGGGCRWVRRISFLRECWRLAKSVPSLRTRQEREATLLTEFNRCGGKTTGGEKLSRE